LEALDAGNDGLDIGFGLEVGRLGNVHVEGAVDGQDTAGCGTTAEVLGHGHRGVVGGWRRRLNASSPLHGALNSVLALDNFPEHGADVGGRLGENTSAALEVGIFVRFDGIGPGLVEVVEGDIGVADNEIGVDVVVEVLSDREVDPLGLVDESRAVLSAVLDDVELGGWANTAAEQDLGGTEGTSGENDFSSLVEGDVSAVASVAAGKFDASDLGAIANDPSDGGVHP